VRIIKEITIDTDDRREPNDKELLLIREALGLWQMPVMYGESQDPEMVARYRDQIHPEAVREMYGDKA
jgi:hypothetical protein